MHKDLFHDKVGTPFGHQGQVIPLMLKRVDIRGLDSFNPLQHQDALSRQGGVNLRHMNLGVVFKLAGKTLDIGQLYGKIDFPGQAAGKFMNNGRGPMPLDFFQVLFHQPGNMGQDLQVNGYQFFNIGPLYLDHYVSVFLFSAAYLTVKQPGLMNLADGGGSKGMRVKIFKYISRITPKLLLVNLLYFLIAERRHAILEFCQFV